MAVPNHEMYQCLERLYKKNDQKNILKFLCIWICVIILGFKYYLHCKMCIFSYFRFLCYEDFEMLSVHSIEIRLTDDFSILFTVLGNTHVTIFSGGT